MRAFRPFATLLLAAACSRTALDGARPLAVRIVARDFAFTAPDTLPAGPVLVTFHNDGPSYHHLQLVRLTEQAPSGILPESVLAAALLPSWMLPVGGAEGADSIARDVVVELMLTPGRYLWLCRITPSDGIPHAAIGMYQSLVVVGDGPARVAAIPADTLITLRDYAIIAPDSLSSGSWRLRVRNSGPHEHQLSVARLAPGRTLQDVLADEEDSTPPYQVLGGTAGLGPRQENVLVLELPPGRYVYMCFVPDPERALDHFQMGMVRLLVVAP